MPKPTTQNPGPATAQPGLPDPLPADPLPLVAAWFDEARRALGPEHANPTAMTLATADAAGAPDARIVLCKGFDAARGTLTFFTDRSSRKGRQLGENPRAAAVFYWEELYRQIRFAGPVAQTSAAESDAYFATRPAGAQISASISRQSAPLASREDLVDAQRQRALALGLDLAQTAPGGVERPARWGGYRLLVARIELWWGQPNRLHDRAAFEREVDAAGDPIRFGAWSATRLQP